MCPAGSYAAAGGVCQSCPSGTYAAQPGSASCTEIPAGMAMMSVGQLEPEPCDVCPCPNHYSEVLVLTGSTAHTRHRPETGPAWLAPQRPAPSTQALHTRQTACHLVPTFAYSPPARFPLVQLEHREPMASRIVQHAPATPSRPLRDLRVRHAPPPKPPPTTSPARRSPLAVSRSGKSGHSSFCVRLASGRATRLRQTRWPRKPSCVWIR